ncbi:BCCT family transporter [Dehalobacterium formicoaceticum]|uniref:BCCT family transporter n=1 Tax=Dehalobacterium formicoaceticum TaxID=51515 RepID=A0ABT1Y1J1_9FIRM|nr:BCCT family transporter [Dehalobacterium formicoaceticum]MCR6544060.1 BCCT family transporter [Dehalobacterium formicoaceticum]
MNFLKKVDKAVFYPAAVICILFIAWMALVPESAGQTLNNALNFINSNFAWLYILSISAFVIVCLVIASTFAERNSQSFLEKRG